LAASAEILLRFCEVDVCVSAESENIMVHLEKHWDASKPDGSLESLADIKGIAYLDQAKEVAFTGYDVAIPASDFLDPDWSILEEHVGIDHYLKDPLERYDFAQDPRSYEPQRKGKKSAPVVTAKGCVARCTFCHRWDRGYRHWPVERIINKIKYLMGTYNVGFIRFADENFGSDRKKLDELIEQLKPLDILYQVGGVRVASVDLDYLRG
jgi:anaerobic magnesium-protoporphyrin IX monomethyl ester cyclase